MYSLKNNALIGIALLIVLLVDGNTHFWISIVAALIFLILIIYPFLLKQNISRQKVVFFSIAFAIAIVPVLSTFFSFPPSLTADYSASVNVGENIYLNESYIYHVNSHTYHALYRNFETNLVVSSPEPDSPYVRLLNVSSPITKYAVDYLGRVYVWCNTGKTRIERMIKSRKRHNEVGIVSLNYLPCGDYRVNYSFLLYPEVLSAKYRLIKLCLAQQHVPYDSVKIKVRGVFRLYALFPAEVERRGETWIVTGKSSRNGVIELEMLLKKSVNGYIVNVSNVTTIVDYDYGHYKFFAATSKYVEKAGFVLLFLAFVFPVFPLALARRRKRVAGKVRRNWKPWEVNLLFKGDAGYLDEDGLKATLLDLERRGYIDIENLKVLKVDDELDPFEKGVLEGIKNKNLSQVALFAGKYSKIRENLLNEVFDMSNYITVKKTFYASLIALFAATVIYYLWKPYGWRIELAILSIFGVMSLCVFSPVQAFCTWKEEYLGEKERLMKKFYEDEEDIVYAVALGKKFENDRKYLAVAAAVVALGFRLFSGGGGGGGGAGGW